MSLLILEFFKDILSSSLSLLNSTSAWLVFSYIVAGLLHDIVSPVRFQKSLGNTKLSSIFKVTVLGMCFPICSCGTIPLGISFYYSGAYLGPTLAFLGASPSINPAAVILSFGLLGKELTLINIGAGFILPFILGIIGNKLGGDELRKPNLEEEIANLSREDMEKIPLKEKLLSGLHWAVNDFGVVLSKYVVYGMLFGGFILTAFPDSFIQKYLGNPSMLSLWNVAVLGALMYVCAVGHIPFIAALIASGASPGAAITFLMAGAATNIPELITIYKMIGKKTAIIYATVISVYAFIVGYLTNLWLMPGFKPSIVINKIDSTIEAANKLLIVVPEPITYICTIIVLGLFVKSVYPSMKNFFMSFKGEAR